MKFLATVLVLFGIGLTYGGSASACSGDELADVAVAQVKQLAQGGHGSVSEVKTAAFSSSLSGFQVVVSFKFQDAYSSEPLDRIGLAQFDSKSCQLISFSVVSSSAHPGSL